MPYLQAFFYSSLYLFWYEHVFYFVQPGPKCMYHLRILDSIDLQGNPRYYSCMQDEDLMKRVAEPKLFIFLRSAGFILFIFLFFEALCCFEFVFSWAQFPTNEVKAMLLYVHPVTFSLRGLQKYCIAVCLRWLQPKFAQDAQAMV